MKLSYKIENQIHNIYIKNRISNSILTEIKKLKSDQKILLVYDEKINPKIIKKILINLKISGCKIFSSKLKSNKRNKNQKLLFSIIDKLIANNFSKKSIVISCGGGVISDVCGLAASLYLRGMYYFNIPTTMTAVVDSCIGGKTAINYDNIINCIGNYYHANSVFISEDIIKDIPEREYIAGIPEILKCGIIKKNRIIKILKKNKKDIINRNFNILKGLLSETLKTKINFFINDIKEKGSRLNLNFGHTFAHAIEMATANFKDEYLRHGEAVGIGMLCEIYFSITCFSTSSTKSSIRSIVKPNSSAFLSLILRDLSPRPDEFSEFFFISKGHLQAHQLRSFAHITTLLLDLYRLQIICR